MGWQDAPVVEDNAPAVKGEPAWKQAPKVSPSPVPTINAASPDATGTLAKIGTASGLGGVAGYFAPEILTGLGYAAPLIPGGAVVSPFLLGTGQMLRGHRIASTAAGVVGGLGGETAGQAVEHAGGPGWMAETARFAGGAVAPEVGTATIAFLKRYALTPALSVWSKFKKETAREVLKKIEGGGVQTLSEREKAFLDDLVKELRGGQKSDADLEGVGRVMGREADDVTQQAERVAQSAAAGAKVGNVAPLPMREVADIGNDLRTVITSRNQAAITQRSTAYKTNEKQRDAVVAAKEQAGQFVNKTPEYEAIVDSLTEELKPGVRSASVQAGIRRILDDLQSAGTQQGERKLVLSGQNLDFVQGPPVSRPMTFQALDDVRRKLGEAFRGKPAEGYEAIGETMAKDLYGKVSEVQKKFAGNAQTKLLDEYALATEGLQQFVSKTGRKATALDKFNVAEFATDASALPKTYFKTRESVRALTELTGSKHLVGKSAIEFANKELEGATAAQARSWMNRHSEMLDEMPVVKNMIANHVRKLEFAEASTKSAADFVKRASADAKMLTRDALPAQRAVELIQSGSVELWEKVGPAIAQSPQAKTQMVKAVRQVLADQASAKGTIDFWSRNLRPFLEKSNIAQRAELDSIGFQLDKIANLQLPEEAKLGVMKRLLLQGSAAWAASAAARAGVDSFRSNQVPQ